MERALRPIFDAVGINFVARNYAMGGTASSPELAMCTESIYGTDVDVISWDFGMTDGRDPIHMGTYFYRAANIPSHPVGVALHVSRRGGYLQALQDLERKGMSMFYLVEGEETAAIMGTPETFGLTEAQIEALPTHVRSFRCNSQYPEVGDPTCSRDKWNNTMCVKRRFRTNWHPGW
jgi:hypothetical protein